MTAIEKAKELYNKYRNENSVMTANIRAKKQAIIAVDEIIKANPYSVVMNSTVRFWQEVKTELEKL